MATGFKGLNDLGKVLAAQEKSIVQSAQKRASEERQADAANPAGGEGNGICGSKRWSGYQQGTGEQAWGEGPKAGGLRGR